MELRRIITSKTVEIVEMVKVNHARLPIKAHYFFFMAAMGPILPFLPVFGKHLGVSEVVMGSINGALPLLFLAMKPFFGYIIDYFQERRKMVFIFMLFLMGLFFFLMAFIPDGYSVSTHDISCADIQYCEKTGIEYIKCKMKCGGLEEEVQKAGGSSDCLRSYNETCRRAANCSLLCQQRDPSFYTGFSFWTFVLLMSLGSIGYNISNSISDAICFNILGDGGEMDYGKQRVWGTIGFGLAALIGGYFMNIVEHQEIKSMADFYPAILLCSFCMLVDIACCLKLKLPSLPKSENIIRDISCLVKQPHIATFLVFAVFVGVCDSSIIFYLLWYLEDLAKETNQYENIKLLQGLTVAAETLVGEVVSFSLSGVILRKLGFGHCLSLCFLFYSLRLGLIALIPSPWWILPVEMVFQGPTYALCYTTVVAYANAASPPGTSGTVQGIVAGMDDGFGFALGSMVGSIVYKMYGGRVMYTACACLALTCSVTHCVLFVKYFKHSTAHPTVAPPAYIIAEEKKRINELNSVEDGDKNDHKDVQL